MKKQKKLFFQAFQLSLIFYDRPNFHEILIIKNFWHHRDLIQGPLALETLTLPNKGDKICFNLYSWDF